MTGTQALANAIVAQAAKDYYESIQALKRNPSNRVAKANAKKIEKFFRSAWYSMLTDLDPDYLLDHLQKEGYNDGKGVPKSSLLA